MNETAIEAPTSSRADSNPRARGRRRGFGMNNNQHVAGTHNDRFRSPRGDYGRRGRGRASMNGPNYVSDHRLRLNDVGRLDPSPGNGGSRGHPNSRTVIEIPQSKYKVDEGQAEFTEEQDVCFICASTIEHLSITPCNHQTCHICALRLRALYKKRDCAYCKSEAPYVIFTNDAAKRYEDFSETDFVRSDETLGIKYEKDVILEDTILLLRYNCPDRDCDTACLGWPHLHRHVKQKHEKLMCDLCVRNKKAFTHEHELFTFSELRRHEKTGDNRSGASHQSGFKGHPECGFCQQRFYGDDELYEHCREKHERCHICDRRAPGSQVQYYLNYDMLEKHFQSDHFVCLDAECQANKTNVFESEIDLKAHQLSSHPNGLSKDARRDARLVNISSFDYRVPYHPQRRERDHRGNGRGRDPNAEPLPISSAQPLRRDELAYQRQMAILNAQPQLIPRNHAASPAPRSPRPEVLPLNPVPDLTRLSLDLSSAVHRDQNQTQTPQEQARQIAHTAVLQRASNLLRADNARLSTFRKHVSSYTSSLTNASELIDSFFSLFDVSSAELGKLVRELADIYEDDMKRQDLLKAWNDWLSINADYPSLPGPNGILPGTNSDGNDIRPGGRRVLRLKSSTAQSSRSDASRQSGWDNVLPNTTSSASQSKPFPPLGGASSLSNGQPRTAWTGIQSSTLSLSSTKPASTPAPASSGNATNKNSSNHPLQASKSPRPNDEMFPALPSGQKPKTLMAGLTKGAARWGDSNRGPTMNPWTTSGAAKADGITDAGAGVDGIGSGPGSKRGKKGKQVLYKFG